MARRALTLEPNNAASVMNLGEAYLLHVRYTEAALWFQKAVLEWSHPDAAVRLLSLNDRLGKDLDPRLVELSLNSTAPFATDEVGPLIERQQGQDQAFAYYHERSERGDPHALFHVAIVLEDRGELTEARRKRELAARAGDAAAMRAFAFDLENRGEGERARRFYRRAVSAGDTEATILLALSLTADGQNAEAKTLLIPLGDDSNPEANYRLGMMALAERDNVSAESRLRRAANAGHSSAIYELAAYMQARGRTKAAARWRDRSRQSPTPLGAAAELPPWVLRFRYRIMPILYKSRVGRRFARRVGRWVEWAQREQVRTTNVPN